MSELEALRRRFDRERAARKEAESLLEEKSREVFAANRQLNELAEYTRGIVEHAAEGIFTYNDRGQVESINRSARRIFELDETRDLTVAQLLDAEDLDAVVFPVELDQQGLPISSEVTGIRSSGKTFLAELAVSSMMFQQSRIYTAVVRDFSRRKAVEEQLRQSKKMESVGQMAAGIAHEINTPIQFIGNNMQFLRGAFDDLGQLLDLFQQLTEAVRAGLDTTHLLEEIDSRCELADLPFLRAEFPGAIEQSLEGIERVATIVRAMKEFAQPAWESKTLVNINRVIENIVAVSTHLYQDIASIDMSLDDEIPAILLAEARMNQTVLYLLTNAVESIARSDRCGHGNIQLVTRMVQNGLELKICDNGEGIPPEIQDRIFDPFFTTKDVGQGSGQGLAFAYDVIVNKHHGSIHVTSHPSEGTTFTLTLPFPVSYYQNPERPEHAVSAG